MVYQNQTDAAKGAAIKAFLNYIYNHGQKLASSVDYAPLPKAAAQAGQGAGQQDRRPGVLTSSGSGTGRVPPARPVPPLPAAHVESGLSHGVIAPPRRERAPGARRRRASARAGARPGSSPTTCSAGWRSLSGLLVLVILGLIAYTTTKNAWPWFKAEGFDIFADNWDPAKGQFGAGAMIYGTFLVGCHRARHLGAGEHRYRACSSPRSRPSGCASRSSTSVDLLAAIPSVVYGLWALYVLRQPLADIYSSISSATGDIPILEDALRRPEPDRLELHDRRDHRRDHDHADRHLADP